MKTWQKLKQHPELFQRYFVKEYMIKAIRKFFEDRQYHELESPILTTALPQERYLDVLDTTIELKDGKNVTAYLIPTTETFNKKILAAGLGNHFVISKVFRGLEEISPNHSPEFTMLEWYELSHTYFDLMQSTEDLIAQIIKFLDQKFSRQSNFTITYQTQPINFSKPWDRITVRECLKKYAGIELEQITELPDLQKIAKGKGYQIQDDYDWQTCFEIIFASEVEPNFAKDKPTFVYDFPRILCPLVKVKESDPLVCEKVEFYIAVKEMGNGYTELLDWQEQQKRFEEEQQARKELNKKAVAFDHGMVAALKSGVPAVAGIGIGLDRLAMILADVAKISDVNYFPISEDLDD
jgi:lysyl-tRNA synthetase, class II